MKMGFQEYAARNLPSRHAWDPPDKVDPLGFLTHSKGHKL